MNLGEKSYQQLNSETIDRWVKEGWEWGTPIDQETYLKAKQGEWQVVLTPTKAVPKDWFGDLHGKKVLGLASGGGQQMPIFTALGAVCTVFDNSPSQLASEQMVATREGYEIEIIQGDMTKPLPFENEAFDLIFHPVSNVYIEEVEPVFRECFRILKPGGILLCGLDNGINFIVDELEKEIVHSLPVNPLRNQAHRDMFPPEEWGYQFSHTLAEQLGGQLKAGFILTHLDEDLNGTGRLHELNIPTFLMTRAIKPE